MSAHPGVPITPTAYFAAKFTGQAAQNLFMAGIFLAAGTSSSAAMDLSSVLVAVLIPAVLFGPIGGAIADRIGVARAYPIGAALRLTVAIAALVIVPIYGWIWAAAFAYSAVSQIFTPAELALVRTIRPGHSGGVHSTLQAVQYGGQGAGMLVLAPLLFVLGGLPAILAGAAFLMVLLVVLTALVGRRLGSVEIASERALPGHRAGVRETVAFFLGEHTAAYAVVLQSFKSMVSRGVFIALPLYLTHDLGVGGDMLVYLIVPGVAGVAAALIWSGRSLGVEQAASVMRWSMIGLITAVAALAALDYGISAMARYSQVPPVVSFEASLNTTFAVAVPVAFLLGIVLTTSVIAGRVVFTELAPRGQQARVFAVQEVFSEGLLVAPMLLTGVGVTYAGARPVLAAIGIAGVALLIALEMSRPRVALPATEPVSVPIRDRL